MKVWLCFLLSLAVAGITLLYVSRVLLPWNEFMDAHHGIKSQMGDLYPRWVGSRELLLHHSNPYGPEVSHEIQMAYYGHPIIQNLTNPHGKLIDEQRFAYPIYTSFLFAATVELDFSEVHRWARLILAICAALSVFFCLAILGWRPPWQLFVAIILFTLSSPATVQGLKIEQLAIVVGCLLTAAAWCVTRNKLGSAGVALALSTIKPQMALFPLCWFAIWAVGDIRKRWLIGASFLATLGALVEAGNLFLPGWIGYFVDALGAYRKYFPTSSLLQVVMGTTTGALMGTLAASGLLANAWQNRKAKADSQKFVSILAQFFVATLIVFPLFTPFNQIILLLPTLLLFYDWRKLPRLSRSILVLSLSWPWLASTVLLLVPPRLDEPNYMPLLPSLLVPIFPFVLVGLLLSRRVDSVAQSNMLPGHAE